MTNLNKKTVNSKAEKDYFKIDLEAFNTYTKGLNNSEKFILLTLFKFKNKEENSYPSLETIREVMSSKEETPSLANLSKSLHSLERKGFIEIEKIFKGGSLYRNNYKVKRIPNTNFEDKIMVSFLINKFFKWEERLFLMQIYPYVFADSNEIKFSKLQLSKNMNISYPTIDKRIKQMTEKGVLTKTEDGFTFNMQKVLNLNEQELTNFISQTVDKTVKMEKEVLRLEKENARLVKENTELKEKVISLEKRIAKLEGRVYRPTTNIKTVDNNDFPLISEDESLRIIKQRREETKQWIQETKKRK